MEIITGVIGYFVGSVVTFGMIYTGFNLKGGEKSDTN